MGAPRNASQIPSPGVTILVVDRDEDIRSALGDFLEDAGYSVILAGTLTEAEALIDGAEEPMVLVVGDAEAIDRPGTEFFTAVAANPVSHHVYLYRTTTPERRRFLALVQTLSDLQSPTADVPSELVSLLTVVAAAAARLSD